MKLFIAITVILFYRLYHKYKVLEEKTNDIIYKHNKLVDEYKKIFDVVKFRDIEIKYLSEEEI